MKRLLCAALGVAWMGLHALGCGPPEDPEAELAELADDGGADQPVASDGRSSHLRCDVAALPRQARVEEAAPDAIADLARSNSDSGDVLAAVLEADRRATGASNQAYT